MLLVPERFSSRLPLRVAGSPTLAALGLVLLGCCCREQRVEHYDLARSSPLAIVVGERTRLDFGTAESRRFLRRGWSWNEHSEEGSFVWSRGLYSSIELPLIDRFDRELQIRARPYRPPGAPPLELRVEVNGEVAGEEQLTGGTAELTIAVPAALWRIGDNLLGFRYSHSHRSLSPNEPTGEMRDVALAWHSLLVVRPNAPPADASDPLLAPFDTAKGRLRLPCGLRLDFPLDLAAGSQLRLDRLDIPSGCGLVVQLRELGGNGVHRIAHLTVPASELTIDLGLESFTAARLSLIVTGERQERRVTLLGSQIVAPRGPG